MRDAGQFAWELVGRLLPHEALLGIRRFVDGLIEGARVS